MCHALFSGLDLYIVDWSCYVNPIKSTMGLQTLPNRGGFQVPTSPITFGASVSSPAHEI